MHEIDLRNYRPLDDEQIYYFHQFPWAEAASQVEETDTEIYLERVCRFLRSRCPHSPLSHDALADVIERVFATPLQASAQFRKYSIWAQLFSDPWFTFMNYGYKDLDGEKFLADLRPKLTEGEELFLAAAQFYARTASVADLSGRDVLEVGSGRGGGAALLHRVFAPRRYVGLDGTRSNVEFCRSVHNAAQLEFVHGNAERLPFDSGAFDTVINIESCTYYRPFSDFVSEVRRVLRPGGTLCIAWFEQEAALWSRHETIEACGLELVSVDDVTTNVREAMREANGGRPLLARVDTRLRKKLYYEAFEAIYDADVVLPPGARYVACAYRRD